MRRPAHQWETPRHVAVRVEASPETLEGLGPRAEAYRLDFASGHEGRALLGLDGQRVDARSLEEDAELLPAIMAWLAARGGRHLRVMTQGGELVLERAFSVSDLDTAQARAGAGRVVTLAPSNAEIVDVLGCFHRVVACEDSSDVPADFVELERLGPDLNPDLERIAVLRPDLVVSSLTVPGMERVVSGLRARGIPQVVLAPKSLADVRAGIERVGACLGCASEARDVLADLDRQRRELEARRPKVPARVYLEWWPRPMFTPGRDCYSNELIALAGGVNVFGDRPGSSLQIEPHELVAAAPDVCFVSWCGVPAHKLRPEHLIERSGLGELAAVQRGRVHALDERFSGRPGPNMLEAARRMAAAIGD